MNAQQFEQADEKVKKIQGRADHAKLIVDDARRRRKTGILKRLCQKIGLISSPH